MFYIFQELTIRIPPELLQIVFISVLKSTRWVKEPKPAHLYASEQACWRVAGFLPHNKALPMGDGKINPLRIGKE
jgi:hypothetical protein